MATDDLLSLQQVWRYLSASLWSLVSPSLLDGPTMTELEKYILATVFLFFFFGLLFFLSALIPQLIERALPI